MTGSGMNMESHESTFDMTNTDTSGEKIRVWRIVGQSLSVLFRNIMPFAILALVVVAAAAGIGQLLAVPDRVSTISAMSYQQLTLTVLDALGRVPVDAVIAMAVWAYLGGRRFTLKESAVSVVRAIPDVLHRPFRLFVSRIFTVSLFRSAFSIPYHITMILILASEAPPLRTGSLYMMASLFWITVETLVDSRLLVLIPAAAVERGGVRQSMRRCWRLTSRHWARVLGVVFVVDWAFVGPVSLSMGLRVAYRANQYVRLLMSVTRLLMNTFLRIYQPVVAAVCYRHIRVANGEIAPARAGVPPTA